MTTALTDDLARQWGWSDEPADTPPELDEQITVALQQAYALTQREVDVLHLVACGLSNQEIAGSLYLSINSVKTYIRSAYRKIDVTRRSQAVAWSVHRGLGHRARTLYAVPQPRSGD